MADLNRGRRISSGENECSKCNEIYLVSVLDDNYPNRDNEYIYCPYCKNHDGYVRTSGYIDVQKK